jgi:hypothetical protein
MVRPLRHAKNGTDRYQENLGADLHIYLDRDRQKWRPDPRDVNRSRMQALIEPVKIMSSNVPRAQRQRMATTISGYLQRYIDRDETIAAAYTEGKHTMTAIAGEPGISVSRVSRVVAKCGMRAKGKTWPCACSVLGRPAPVLGNQENGGAGEPERPPWIGGVSVFICDSFQDALPRQKASRMVAMPCPPPMHCVASA